jgi:hypothetical protein
MTAGGDRVALPAVRDEGPVSSAQRRLWFLQALSPADPAYNISAAAEITGPLSLPALRRAVHTVGARHPALRSVFHFAEGRLTRHETAASPPLCVVDLKGQIASGDADLPAEADALLRRLAAVPFDLSAGPPVRWAVLRCSPRRHVLQLVVHHIVFDAASLAIVVRDLQAAYAWSLGGRPGGRSTGQGSVATADAPPASEAAHDAAAQRRAAVAVRGWLRYFVISRASRRESRFASNRWPRRLWVYPMKYRPG